MKQTLWYRYILCGIFLVPALMFQSIYPLISFSTWEQYAESLYRIALSAKEPDQTVPSKVVVIEIDQKTWDTYGWPIDRTIYIKALDKLKKHGHPWILSMLQFQELEKRQGESKEKSAGKDLSLAKEIQQYDRYIGSGLTISPGSILDADQEDRFLPKILLSSTGKVPTEIPELPLSFAESNIFIEAQKSFGYGARFGTESIIHCLQSYLTDAEHRGDFVILSSLIWAAAYAGGKKIDTATGASWPRLGDVVPFPLQSSLKVAYKLCDSFPGILSQDYHQLRGIDRISLVDIVDGSYKKSLANKIVVLASSEMRTFRGPGYEYGQKTAVVKEHLLAARFLDQIVNETFILRGQIKEDAHQGWLPILVALGLFCLSFFASPLLLVILNMSLLIVFMIFGIVNLGMDQFFIPIQTLYSLGLSQCLLIFLLGYLRYYSIKRQMAFTKNLNQSLSQCNTLEQIQSETSRICAKEFSHSRVVFTDYDKRLYSASNNPQAALELLESKKLLVDDYGTSMEDKLSDHSISTALTSIKRSSTPTLHSPFLPLRMSFKLAIITEAIRLGTVTLEGEYQIYEQHFVTDLANILQFELSQHWNRVKLLVDQKLLDYRILSEESRGKILCRFLTQVLVSKFNDSRTMEENLKLVLTPRVTKAALMQADIRGYSKFSAQMKPADMVQLLQGYFRAVVNAAQVVAQVKLIGDCIFLFIEEESASFSKSPTDLALELAQILVKSTEMQNQGRVAQKQIPMHFGIAIHYGEVVVGNLSSDECIDYTVIGTEVNFVARMEELTKSPKISDIIGPNGIVMSEQAFLNMKAYSNIKPHHIDLKSLQISVRSFPDVVTSYGMTAAEINKVQASEEWALELEPMKLAS